LLKEEMFGTGLVCGAAAVAIVAVCLATLALAHEGATGVVKDRMDLMKQQQKDMKLIGEMAKGKRPFDAARAADAARDISLTAKKIHELFPEGSDGHPSDALPSIWKEWDRFTSNAEDLGSAADSLAISLDGTNREWKAAFQKVTDACKSCHEDFRAKEAEHEHH
jgi:cytochrome c556